MRTVLASLLWLAALVPVFARSTPPVWFGKSVLGLSHD